MTLFPRAIATLFSLFLAAPFAVPLLAPTTEASRAATNVDFPSTSVAQIAAMPMPDKYASTFSALLAADAITSHFSGAPFYYFGDVNGDGTTDLYDFSTLKKYLGFIGDRATRYTGDLTGDGIVGLDDFAVLKFYFGQSTPYLP